MAWNKIKNPGNVNYSQWEYDDSPVEPGVGNASKRAKWQSSNKGKRVEAGNKTVYFKIRKV